MALPDDGTAAAAAVESSGPVVAGTRRGRALTSAPDDAAETAAKPDPAAVGREGFVGAGTPVGSDDAAGTGLLRGDLPSAARGAKVDEPLMAVPLETFDDVDDDDPATA